MPRLSGIQLIWIESINYDGWIIALATERPAHVFADAASRVQIRNNREIGKPTELHKKTSVHATHRRRFERKVNEEEARIKHQMLFAVWCSSERREGRIPCSGGTPIALHGARTACDRTKRGSCLSVELGI